MGKPRGGERDRYQPLQCTPTPQRLVCSARRVWQSAKLQYCIVCADLARREKTYFTPEFCYQKGASGKGRGRTDGRTDGQAGESARLSPKVKVQGAQGAGLGEGHSQRATGDGESMASADSDPNIGHHIHLRREQAYGQP